MRSPIPTIVITKPHRNMQNIANNRRFTLHMLNDVQILKCYPFTSTFITECHSVNFTRTSYNFTDVALQCYFPLSVNDNIVN